MHVWRICRRPFADLSGEGARRLGGRWNSPGRPVVYTAENAALAVLEVRVHLDITYDLVPADYVLLKIDIGMTAIETVADPPPADWVAYGDAWLASARSPLLRVPSAIVLESFNILLNPAHPDAAAVGISGIRPFSFDERLWAPRY